MMKRVFLIALAAMCSISAWAQEEKDGDAETREGGFKKEMLFTGGNLNVGFFGGVTVLGANPQLGYSISKWLDAGISFGYTYTSQHDDYGNKYRQSIIAPGAFARIFPVDFLFASVQFEHNFIKTKTIYINGPEFRESVNAASLLLGLGYTSGREGRNSPYYYFSVSWDILSNPNSPYRDVVFQQDSNSPTGYRMVLNDPYPVVKAGFNIPLFQGSRKRY